MTLNPQELYEERAWANLSFGRLEEALGDVDKAIEALPSTASPYATRAYLLTYKPGTCKRVAADVLKAAELNPHAPWMPSSMALAHVTGLAYACPDLYDSRATLEHPRRIIESPSRAPWNQWILGAALYREGRHEEAVQALEESLRWCTIASARRSNPASTMKRAVAWVDRHTPADLEALRFKEEAAGVLGVGAKTTGRAGEAPGASAPPSR